MSKARRTNGFTQLEMLVVVALIAILSAIAFVGVIAYQRSMEQIELDATAKEIFVAAQNHLTMADGMGLLDQDKGDETANTKFYGEVKDADKDIRYFVYPADPNPLAEDDDQPQSVLGLMLPFGSIEETVRTGYSYVILYQKSSGRVIDVFCAKTSGRFAHKFTVEDVNKSDELAGDDKAGTRKNYSGSVIGWYGGKDLPTGEPLKAPQVTVRNAEMLYVEVKNPNVKDNNSTCQLKLIVTGKTSKAKKAFTLINSNLASTVGYADNGGISHESFTIVFDDITREDKHFHTLFQSADSGTFIPGEDLSIQAIAYRNDKLTNVAKSPKKTTNSLFASLVHPSAGGSTTYTARIRNFRHLENLDATVSSVDVSKAHITSAEQTVNMDWKLFRANINKLKYQLGATNLSAPDYNAGVQVYYTNGSTQTSTQQNTYYPVSPNFDESDPNISNVYDGTNHRISNVDVNVTGNAGLFGELSTSNPVSVKNLELVDFSVSSTDGDAGALAGNVKPSTQIENVLVRHTADGKTITGKISAGGLVGKMTGGSIKNSAAAVYVSATAGSAGGLVGVAGDTNPNATSPSITNSYSGGHTKNGEGQYDTDPTKANVSATGGSAGGLIGTQNGGTISYCYSTCSASSTKSGTEDDVYAGGLIGQGTNGVKIDNCYVTGLVLGDTAKKGIFAGILTGTTMENNANNYYLSIVNEGQKSGDDNVGVIAEGTQPNGITAADADTQSYSNFAPGSATAVAYDSSLGNKYPYKTVAKLTNNENDSSMPQLSKVHYGDWPMVETLVTNTKN